MKRNLFSLPMLALALLAVTALALGSFGSAAAASLTKTAVKKIAAQVVVKKAPQLEVAHATTATTATNASLLDGLDSSKLKTTQFQFGLPAEGATPSRSYTFPALPSGNYFVSYSVAGQMINSTAVLACWFATSPTSEFEAVSYGDNQGGFSAASSSAFLEWSAQSVFVCSPTIGTMKVNEGGNHSTVTFTPVDIPISGLAMATTGP